MYRARYGSIPTLSSTQHNGCCVLDGVQERNVVEVAMDVAKIFGLPESKITYVKDRAFNDQCASITFALLAFRV